jgi:hypothetical protein
MKRLSALLLACVVVPVLQAQDATKLEGTPYYPLEVGNSWHYKAGDNRFILRIAKHEKVGDTLCARVEMITEGKPISFEHLGMTKEGIARFSFEGKEAKPPVVFLKLAPKKGDTWKVDSKVGEETLKGTFEIGEDNVTVPSGIFKVITAISKDLDANGMKINFTYYFAEKVGMVKQVIEVSGQKVVIELEKFEPAKK